MNDVATDAHPEAGAIQGVEVTDSEGMSVEDAATSAYDDHDRATNGIAEGERVGLGQHLKGHADAAGTTVIGGLNYLVDAAVGLRTGDQATKREVIGALIDEHGVHAMPMADDPAPAYATPTNEGQQPITEEQGMAAVQSFIEQNPVARDERIQDHMIYIVNDMRAQGFQPDLGRALEIAVASHPRFSQQAQAETDAATVARARAAAVQVSGGANTAPRGGSDDIGAILDELIP